MLPYHHVFLKAHSYGMQHMAQFDQAVYAQLTCSHEFWKQRSPLTP